MNFFFAIPLVLGFIPAAALSQSPIDGTWKVDLDSYSPGKKPASYIVGAGKFECASCPGKSRIETDGRDHRVEGDPNHDTLAVKLPDERTAEAVGKKAGTASAGALSRPAERSHAPAVPSGLGDRTACSGSDRRPSSEPRRCCRRSRFRFGMPWVKIRCAALKLPHIRRSNCHKP